MLLPDIPEAQVSNAPGYSTIFQVGWPVAGVHKNRPRVVELSSLNDKELKTALTKDRILDYRHPSTGDWSRAADRQYLISGYFPPSHKSMGLSTARG